jgi:hypothetical protein
MRTAHLRNPTRFGGCDLRPWRHATSRARIGFPQGRDLGDVPAGRLAAPCPWGRITRLFPHRWWVILWRPELGAPMRATGGPEPRFGSLDGVGARGDTEFRYIALTCHFTVLTERYSSRPISRRLRSVAMSLRGVRPRRRTATRRALRFALLTDRGFALATERPFCAHRDRRRLSRGVRRISDIFCRRLHIGTGPLTTPGHTALHRSRFAM